MSTCKLITNSCLSCGSGEGLWKGSGNPKFPQTDASYNRYQTMVGGIYNSRNQKTSGSSFTSLKKSLTTVNKSTNKSTLPLGPGDKVESVPTITTTASSGIKTRLSSNKKGVDVKHGSYERYLARKRGFNMRCQGC